MKDLMMCITASGAGSEYNDITKKINTLLDYSDPLYGAIIHTIS